jgi:tetratricopeptide (TPR) repeat protein
MMTRLRTAALVAACTLLVAASLARAQRAPSPRAFVDRAAGAPNRSGSLVERGYDAVYNLDYDAADDLFKQAIAAAPNDPAAYRGAAKTAWLRILFLQGTATTDQYMGKASSAEQLKVPVPPEPWASEFRKNIARAVEIGEKAVRINYKAAQSHYDLGAGLGYLASYTGTIEGKLFSAMKIGRRAYAEHEKVLEIDPKRHDAGLVVGTYRYIVASQSMPVRWLAYLIGFGGNKQLAIQRLEEAAAYPSDAQADARFALILIYAREGRHEDSLRVVRGLEQSYPRNRLLWLEEGGGLLRLGRAAEAERVLDLGIGKMQDDKRPRMGGEALQLHYKRAIARMAQKNVAGAEQDLKTALADTTGPGWVRGRAHLELGKVADLAGDRARARSEYYTAADLCAKSSDPGGAEAARKLLDKPFAW